MLQKMLDSCCEIAHIWFLDVGESMLRRRRYKNRIQCCGKTPDYYSEPPEDAFVMKLDLNNGDFTMLILSFESSCDETSCAVVDMSDESRVMRSNIIASQISIRFIRRCRPEIASRAHCEAISSITDQALDKANITLDEIDAVAVAIRPAGRSFTCQGKLRKSACLFSRKAACRRRS